MKKIILFTAILLLVLVSNFAHTDSANIDAGCSISDCKECIKKDTCNTLKQIDQKLVRTQDNALVIEENLEQSDQTNLEIIKLQCLLDSLDFEITATREFISGFNPDHLTQEDKDTLLSRFAAIKSLIAQTAEQIKVVKSIDCSIAECEKCIEKRTCNALKQINQKLTGVQTKIYNYKDKLELLDQTNLEIIKFQRILNALDFEINVTREFIIELNPDCLTQEDIDIFASCISKIKFLMAFVSREEILELVEKLYTSLIKKFFPEKKITAIPFIRMTHKEAMKKYKSDKPDLRKNKKDPNELAFAFITDFPMFKWHENPSARASTELSRMSSGQEKLNIGAPLVKDAKVIGKVLKQDKAKKVIIFKYKAKKRYKVKKGHRQPFTEVEIIKISNK